jgi:protein involved in polysaccharide export with SLBB domain
MGALLPVVAAAVALSASAHETGYRVGPGDVVDIKIYGETEFSGFFRVGTDGTIDYPFIRKLKAQGKTREELAGEITSLLKDGYLKDPQVSVDVKDYRSQTVFVLGAVNRPGTYALEEDTKILDLLSRAGGISGPPTRRRSRRPTRRRFSLPSTRSRS